MSEFNRKGFISIPAYTVNTLEDGVKTKYKAVRIGSSDHRKYLKRIAEEKRLAKSERLALRDRQKAAKELSA